MLTRSATRLASSGSGGQPPADGRGNTYVPAGDASAGWTQTATDDDPDDTDFILPPPPRPKSRSRSPSKKHAPQSRADKAAPQDMARLGAAATSGAKAPENPDPAFFEPARMTPHEREVEALTGIRESAWVPFRAKPSSNGQFRPRSLRDLRGFRPTRLEFTATHPREDWNDQWYERLTTQLFNRVWAFAEGAFGHKLSSPPESRRRPWSEPFSPQFVHIVSQIARKDDNVGGWDHVLLDGPERCYLAMGIIAKVLDEHVFSELVFGDSETNKKLWSALDESHMSEEGYCRKGMRSRQMRLTMDGNILTPCFWDEVDQLASRTTALLLPLVNLQGKLHPAKSWASLAAVHQELHNIIAMAGYLAICMSWSPSIFRVVFPEPGDNWDLDQNHLDESVYEKSREAAAQYDETHPRPAAHYDEDEAEGSATSSQSSGEQDDGDSAGGEDDEDMPADRVAKIKIVGWPLVQRYKPLGKAVGYGAPHGERISTILKSQVVYYAGLDDDESERAERAPLTDHVRKARRWNWQRGVGIPYAIVAVLVIFLAALELAYPHSLSFPYDPLGFGGLPPLDPESRAAAVDALPTWLQNIYSRLGLTPLLRG